MASALEDQDQAGLALIVAGLALMIASIVAVAIKINGGYIATTGYAMSVVGSVVVGIIYIGFGLRVRGGSSRDIISSKLGLSGGAISGKFRILAEYVHVFAFAEILWGLFSLVGNAADGDGIGSAFVDIIVGLVAFWTYYEITNRKTGIENRVLWIVVLVLFILEIISGVQELDDPIMIPLGLCYIVIGIYFIIMLMDRDIRKKFGI